MNEGYYSFATINRYQANSTRALESINEPLSNRSIRGATPPPVGTVPSPSIVIHGHGNRKQPTRVPITKLLLAGLLDCCICSGIGFAIWPKGNDQIVIKTNFKSDRILTESHVLSLVSLVVVDEIKYTYLSAALSRSIPILTYNYYVLSDQFVKNTKGTVSIHTDTTELNFLLETSFTFRN